jgi:hypothetical protein
LACPFGFSLKYSPNRAPYILEFVCHNVCEFQKWYIIN